MGFYGSLQTGFATDYESMGLALYPRVFISSIGVVLLSSLDRLPSHCLNSSYAWSVVSSLVFRIFTVADQVFAFAKSCSSNFLADQICSIFQKLQIKFAYLQIKFASLADQFASLADQICSVADHFASLADHLASLADQICSVADHFASLADHLASLADQIWPFRGRSE